MVKFNVHISMISHAYSHIHSKECAVQDTAASQVANDYVQYQAMYIS